MANGEITGAQKGNDQDRKSQVFSVAGDFNSSDVNVDRFKGTEFKDGNFKMDPDMLKAAREMGQEYMNAVKKADLDLAQTQEGRVAGQLTKDHKITAEAIGAVLLAESLAKNTEGNQPATDFSGKTHPQSTLTATFDNKVDTRAQSLDPQLVFEMARQIMGDNGMKVIGGATDTHQADVQFTQANAMKAASAFAAK